jgi:hypothetical protein
MAESETPKSANVRSATTFTPNKLSKKPSYHQRQHQQQQRQQNQFLLLKPHKFQRVAKTASKIRKSAIRIRILKFQQIRRMTLTSLKKMIKFLMTNLDGSLVKSLTKIPMPYQVKKQTVTLENLAKTQTNLH